MYEKDLEWPTLQVRLQYLTLFGEKIDQRVEKLFTKTEASFQL